MKIGGIIIWFLITAVISFVLCQTVFFFFPGLSWFPLVLLEILLAGPLSFLVIYWYLAPRNLFFTFVKEGSAKIIVKGDEVVDVLIQWKDHTLDKSWEVVKGKESHLFGGLRYYGLWPLYDVYIYNFQWTGITEDGKIQFHPKETLDYILLKEDIYWAKVERAEDINKLPLTLELVLTIQVVNPYKALFAVQNWLEAVVNRSRAQARNIITQSSYEDWVESKESIGTKILEGVGKKEFLQRYGVDIRRIEVKDINPPESYREATLKRYLAEREKEKTLVDAEAEKERIARVYQSIQNFGEFGKLLRTLEAVEKSNLAASLAVQAIPGIQETLKGVFAKNSDEEFKELKKMLQEIQKEIQNSLK